MTIGEYSPLLRDGGGRSSSAQHHQAIDAHYYNITDTQSWPIAGLLVLLDRRRQPVRAELQIDNEFDNHVIEAAVRQARVVMQDQYIGGEPVPLTILTTNALRDSLEVRLSPLGTRTRTPLDGRSRWIAGAAIGVVLLLLALWAIQGFRSGEEPVAPAAAALTAPSAGAGDNVGATLQEDTAADGGEDTTKATSIPLPPSRNARADINIGMRVTVVPTLQVALRTEPGLDSGTTVGALTDSVVATVIGGPEYTEGLRDTIVWWYLQLDSGLQAWAAANTSEQALLIPAD